MTSDSELAGFLFVYSVDWIATTILIFWTIRHGYWVYQDLYTEDRKSVAHRRQKPERTFAYRWVNLFTFWAMFFAILSNLGSLCGFLAANITTCRFFASLGTQGLTGKLMIYFVYLLRLHLVYDGSQYGWRKTSLKGLSSCLCVVIVCLGFVITYSGSWDTDKVDDEDVSDDVVTYVTDDLFNDNWEWSITYGSDTWYYQTCVIETPTLYVIIYAFVDIIVNLAFTIAFIRPIRDVIRKVQGSSRNLGDKSKLTRKMLFVGFKVALLSGVLFTSTFIMLLVYAVLEWDLFPTDFVINSICIALMTPYYPDSKYYQKLCKCCIACCDRKGYTKGRLEDSVPATSPRADIDATVTDVMGDDSENNASRNPTSDKSGTGPSADTMSAVRIAAKEENPLKSDTNDTEMELATHLNN